MNINRKTFIGGMIAGIATQLFGCNKFEFDDIRVDRYYVLIGNNRVPEGCPGSDVGKYLIEDLKYESNFRPIEEVIDELAARKFHYEVSSYIFDKEYVEYDDIHLTKEWLTEFYNRHKDEDIDSWNKAYESKLLELKNEVSI